MSLYMSFRLLLASNPTSSKKKVCSPSNIVGLQLKYELLSLYLAMERNYVYSLTIFLNCFFKYANNGSIPVESSRYFKNLTCPTTFTPLAHCFISTSYSWRGLKFKIAQFDLYCTLIKEKLGNGICTKCGKYWPSKEAMKRHRKAHK